MSDKILDLTEVHGNQETSVTMDNVVGSNTTRVYPYKMINASKEKNFLKPNSVSIVAISNDETNFNENYSKLKKDENGLFYFELYATIDVSGGLFDSTATSVDSLQYKEIPQFTGITNMWNETNIEKPVVFFLNKPFNKDLFEAGTQQGYIAPNVQFSAPEVYNELQEQADHLEMFKWAEIDFVDLTTLEDQFSNAKIMLTTNVNFSKDVSSFDGNTGISLGIESHTLLHSIKAKGTTEEFDAKGNSIGIEYGEVELISKDKFAPFKATPSSTREKTTMYFDWFDYDTVLPFVFIEKFRAGETLDKIITNDDDRKMVEDMITISAGFASSWDSAPVFISGTEAGKIKPDFRVGNSGIKVSVIAGKDPVKVIDGIYENHIRKHPAFETDTARYQPVKATINALSRYIYSSYAIGKGQNSFNMAYLPWYLEPHISTPIEFNKALAVKNPDKGSTGDVTSYVLNDDIKFQAKTIYFHGQFSQDIPVKGKPELLLPKNINFSNQKLIQTDRKLTLPELPDSIASINKLPLPGDINTKSSQDLMFMFYLPIQDQTKFEEFMLNKLTAHSGVAVGTDVLVNLDRGPDGKKFTQLQVNGMTLAKQSGIIKTPSTITTSSKATSKKFTIHLYERGATDGDNGASVNGVGIPLKWREFPMKAEITKYLVNTFGYDPATIDWSEAQWINGFNENHTWTLYVTHDEFSPATVTTTSQAGKTYSFQGRQVLFDKQEWEEFLVKFGIVPDGFTKYSFDERPNWKIKHIDELVIQSVWGNSIEVYFGSGPNDFIKVPLFNKDDETIATERILFI